MNRQKEIEKKIEKENFKASVIDDNAPFCFRITVPTQRDGYHLQEFLAKQKLLKIKSISEYYDSPEPFPKAIFRIEVLRKKKPGPKPSKNAKKVSTTANIKVTNKTNNVNSKKK